MFPCGMSAALVRCVTFTLILVGAAAAVFAAPQNVTEEDLPPPNGVGGGTDLAVPTSPREIIEAIGYSFAAVFIVASVVAVWSAIDRLFMLRHRRVIPRAFVDRFLMHLRTGRMNRPNAVAVSQQNGSPVAEVFLHGVRKWGRPSVEIEQAVIDGGERQVSLLRKRLRVLNGVATLMPLIGLLGTVIGMIQAFNDIARSNAMGQAQELALGIAMALLTTAIGLFIAIPALAVYMFLAARVDSLVVEMDRLGQELVHLISAEALRDRGEYAAPEARKNPASEAGSVAQAAPSSRRSAGD